VRAWRSDEPTKHDVHSAAGNLRGHLVGSRTLIDVEADLAWIRSHAPPAVSDIEDEPNPSAADTERAGQAERAPAMRPSLAA
jgi:hypothetical protein